ncbi:MAG: cytochrome C oxidase subunit IV, partial [Candidatus Hydrogenedentota bacterium]
MGENHSHVPLLAKVFGALVTLTIITVLVAYVDVGSAKINILVAMGIATLKALF